MLNVKPWYILHHDYLQVLGMGEPWKGGNMESYGGGYKVNLLKAGLEAVKNNPKQLVMFVDR